MQINNEILLHTGQNGHYKQSNKQQVLARVWRQGNPSALLVGTWSRATTMEATAWMELESIMLSKISQAVKDKYHMISPLTGT